MPHGRAKILIVSTLILASALLGIGRLAALVDGTTTLHIYLPIVLRETRGSIPPTATSTAAPTATATGTPTLTPTPTATDTKQPTGTATSTPTTTPSRTPTSTVTATATSTNTPRPTATATPTHTPKPTATTKPTRTPKPTATRNPGCDPAYPTVCIPSPPPDLDCSEIEHRNFTVLSPDPHNFDSDNDGIGCESN